MRLPVESEFLAFDKRVYKRWGFDPAIGTADYGEDGLKEMCDYGAKQIRRGEYDALEFNVMPREVEFIKQYMAETHPNIRYRFK